MKNCGFSETEAKQIEANYHKLYEASDQWVQDKIKFACENGFIETGFGLKVRTPLLKASGYSTDLKGAVASEARTAGNALGQGWGVLNDRAMGETLNQIDLAGLSEVILPVAKIH